MMPSKRTLALIIGPVAAAASIAFTGDFEGLSNTPYRDTGGVWTVCRGQTGVPMRYYSDAACDAMLADELGAVEQTIINVTPGYTTLPEHVRAATRDFAYNVGTGAYGKSTYRQMLIRRELPAACNQIARYKYVGALDCSVRSNNCYGVWTRRLAEVKMCKGE
jgi:lysozyme